MWVRASLRRCFANKNHHRLNRSSTQNKAKKGGELLFLRKSENLVFTSSWQATRREIQPLVIIHSHHNNNNNNKRKRDHPKKGCRSATVTKLPSSGTMLPRQTTSECVSSEPQAIPSIPSRLFQPHHHHHRRPTCWDSRPTSSRS